MKKLNHADNSLNSKRKELINEAAKLFSQLSPEVQETIIMLIKDMLKKNK